MNDINAISGIIIDTAYHIHKNIGPGLLESDYEIILQKELEKRELIVERQKIIPISYEGLTFSEGFKADLIVNSMVIIELKSIEALAPVHSKQLLTYLRLLDYRLGL